MSEAYLQILLILAYLAIGLIAITFPIHTICITYLRQEKWETEMERRKRVEKLRKVIDELNKDLAGQEKGSGSFSEIQKQIQGHKAELKALKLRVGYLTAWGAVGRPILILGFALISAILGIYYFYEEHQLVVLWILTSGVLSAIAIFRLYNIISTIEFASLRPARTIQFEVQFGSGKKSEKIKLKTPTILSVSAGTNDADLEHFEISIFIPPEISIVKMITLDVYGSTQGESANFPNYVMVTRQKEFAPSNVLTGISLEVSANKVGKFDIPVKVFAKGVYSYKTNLTLVVVK